MKNFAKNIFLILFIFIAIFSNIIINEIGNFDELWNYNFARNVANGLLPYKDFNMLQMPLFPFVCAIFLKLIANELIIMRILAATLCTGIIYVIYKILNLLKIDKRFSFLFAFFIAFISRDIFCIDYNWFTLFIVLNIIYFEINLLKRNNFDILCLNYKNDIILGIMAGMCIGFKQTSGLLICIILLGYKLLVVSDKNDFKRFLKIFFRRLFGVLIPVILILFYLVATNSLKEFIDYTILGIKNFDNSVSYIALFNLSFVIKILAILVPLTIVYMYIKTVFIKMKNNKDRNLFILFAYSISTFIIVYPIADKIHFIIAAIPTIIAMFYILYNLFNRIKLNKKAEIIKDFLLYMITSYIVIFVLLYSVYNLLIYLKNDNKSILEHFKYLPISTQLQDDVIKVGNYILEQEKIGKKTYILDAYASIYMIPLNKYNKDYDMFLKGNLGSDETNKIINNINNEKNLNILIRNKKYSLNWQTPVDIINILRNSKTKIDEINCFDIYN